MSVTQVIREMYLFCRTTRSMEYSEEVMWRTCAALPDPPEFGPSYAIDRQDSRGEMFVFDQDRITWQDGFVLRFRSEQAPIDAVNVLSESLSELDAWGIHDGHGAFAENPSGGPLSRFVEKLWDGEYQELARRNQAQPIPISQLFLLSRDGDSRFDEKVDTIRASITGPQREALPVFHFRNGRIIFLNSREPGNITVHRCRSGLGRLKGWVIVDSENRSFSAAGEDESMWLNIPRFRFVDDGDEDDGLWLDPEEDVSDGWDDGGKR